MTQPVFSVPWFSYSSSITFQNRPWAAAASALRSAVSESGPTKCMPLKTICTFPVRT